MPAQVLAITVAEAEALFQDLENVPALVLAISGGPDSTALMLLMARWRKAHRRGPELIAVTVDHGLRKESKREAIDVARLARKLGIKHRTLRWTGRKPKTGLPQAARAARYGLLAEAARKAKATHVLTAHTLDDQAETVMIRMMRGSGIAGLKAMQRISVMPGRHEVANPDSIITDGRYGFRARGHKATPRNDGVILVRPLLDIPKARLVATLEAEQIPFADDPTNRDAAFTRARLRGLMPRLANEGLDARRLSLLARRLKRADAAIEAAVEEAMAELTVSFRSGFSLGAERYFQLPAEIGLRLLGRAINAVGNEGPVELGKLEALKTALDSAQNVGRGWRRTLAGAVVTLAKGQITVERAPPRRNTAGKRPSGPSGNALTKRRPGGTAAARTR